MHWDPVQYARFAGPRSRPFFDLTARIDAPAPATVLDVGCGTGELTALLAQRWPNADVRGIDPSPEMIASAPSDAGVTFALGRAEDLDASGVDVLVSNAVLQWVPGHVALLRRWVDQLRPGGWIALQVPANADAPTHRLLRGLADSPAWRGHLAGVLRVGSDLPGPQEYQALLTDTGCAADVWQTEYLHVLQGPEPVLEWMRGTGLRPALAALPGEAAARFTQEYAALLRAAYPTGKHGTVLPFRRTFAVARKT